jgi:hypothetical protein
MFDVGGARVDVDGEFNAGSDGYHRSAAHRPR